VTWLRGKFFDAVSAVGKALADTFDLSSFVDWVNGLSGGWSGIGDLALNIMATIVVGVQNIGKVWDVVVSAMHLTWLKLVREIRDNPLMKGDLSSLIGNNRWINSAVTALIPGGSLTRDLMGRIGGPSGVGERLGVFDRLDQRIADLQRNIQNGMGDMRPAIREQADRWRFELDRFGTRMENIYIPVKPNPIEGRDKAISGIDAADARSERAFSLLQGHGGKTDYYAALTADRIQRNNELMVRQVAAMERAPAIRRARL
jgi:hypothetical protein